MITRKTIAEVSELTALNDHCGALAVAAKALGNEKLIERAVSLVAERERLGELTLELSHRRHHVYMDVMEAASQVLSANDYRMFYNSF